ncbi:MAG: SDR family oxidoreductase [Gemmatimonadaceae bacterium]|nr:SDR family oxidoreductase [Acetobacteraceae bacterium]
MNLPLQHKTALVTGASRGIGAAIAQRLAQDGAEVIVHFGSGEAEARQVVAEITARGGRASVLQADLAVANGPAQLAEAVGTRRIDILVNNAGVAPFASIEEMDEANYDRLSNVNMRSLFFVTQKLLPRIPEGGRIVNLSSVVARTAFAGIPAYAATKGFVNTLTVQLAAALGPRGITVNAVAPGAIDTRMSEWIHAPGGQDALQQMQSLSGIGQPGHIAGVVAFLAGPDASWITGEVVEASGGTKL